MLVTVFCAPRDSPETTFGLDVSPELELRDFIALCELESGIPAGEIQVTYIEQTLKDPTRLPHIDFRSITIPGTSSSSGQRGAIRPQQQQASQPQPQQQSQRASQSSTSSPQGMDDPALLQQMLLSNPHELSLLKERNPPLADALLSGDIALHQSAAGATAGSSQERAERIRLLTADPFDIDAQAKIAEDIRQHNVEENMTIAMEEAPESFGSGAQMTIMSQACAERCNIMSWWTVAGPGSQRAWAPRRSLEEFIWVQIEGIFLPCSFSILEDQPMDMLLGLDMLKRHQCSIDLKRNLLLIGTTNTETSFLSEAELPECARLAYGPESREDNRPDETGDRELAEALQRSIQESDTADGQTTSPQPPPPLTLPRTLDQRSSSPSPSQSPSSGPPQTLDRSQSAPVALEQASVPGLIQDQPVPQDPPRPASSAEDAGPSPHQVPPPPLPVQSNPRVSPVPCPSTDVPRSPPADMTTASQGPEGGSESDEVMSSPVLPHAEELSPTQPMEQEATGGDTTDAPEPVRVLLTNRWTRWRWRRGVPERDQPEGEHGSGSDNIPSLAAALMELHELLVSNKRAQSQNRSTSCSPSHPFTQETDHPEPRPPPPEDPPRIPSTAIPAGAEPSDAKAHHAAAAVSDEGPSKGLAPVLSEQEERLDGDTLETAVGKKNLQRPERRADKCGRAEVNNISSFQTEPEDPPDPTGDLEVREPPEGQQGRGVADGRASGTNTPDSLGLQTGHTFLSPLSMAVGSPEEVSSTSTLSSPPLAPQLTSPAPPVPSPHPLREQFPSEHIQTIQAAGFSAREAAEALEQAQGVVELALLALLARSITDPSVDKHIHICTLIRVLKIKSLCERLRRYGSM
ncbi:hypothetical protein F7725_016930 [Dissostichus mawsoni]|uniref:UBA domain-containing protein n=1 Tax=Dissostichus mawsoni TaxID=36200 RepID=A0A7J5Z602_DISMA|nr:hypothetical protein F7725_016930 [Dissostichus mawsoni]